MTLSPDDVMADAACVPGMLAAFNLMGAGIRRDRSALVLQVLQDIGMERGRAWQIVDGWEATDGRALKTGWTAEVAAMGCVMNDVPGWRDVPWNGLLGRLSGNDETPAG